MHLDVNLLICYEANGPTSTESQQRQWSTIMTGAPDANGLWAEAIRVLSAAARRTHEDVGGTERLVAGRPGS